MDNLPGSHDCLGKSWDQAMAANGDHSTEKQWKQSCLCDKKLLCTSAGIQKCYTYTDSTFFLTDLI